MKAVGFYRTKDGYAKYLKDEVGLLLWHGKSHQPYLGEIKECDAAPAMVVRYDGESYWLAEGHQLDRVPGLNLGPYKTLEEIFREVEQLVGFPCEEIDWIMPPTRPEM